MERWVSLAGVQDWSGVMRLGRALVLAVVGMAAVTAHGQYSERFSKCMARAHDSTVQQGLCAQAELTAQDDRLNKAYQQVMSQMPKDDARRIALRDEERSWLKKRDYDCKLNRETIDNDCLLQKTAGRADELEKRVNF